MQRSLFILSNQLAKIYFASCSRHEREVPRKLAKGSFATRHELARTKARMNKAFTREISAVGFGRRAIIQKGSTGLTVTIVGEDESDPKGGLIAWTAPLASAIIGAKGVEQVDLEFGLDQTVTIRQ
jgi:transcription elongation GreA/GreB family factor